MVPMHHAEDIAARLRAVLMRYTGRFVGIQETRALLARMDAGYGDLVKEVLRSVPVPRIAEVVSCAVALIGAMSATAASPSSMTKA